VDPTMGGKRDIYHVCRQLSGLSSGGSGGQERVTGALWPVVNTTEPPPPGGTQFPLTGTTAVRPAARVPLPPALRPPVARATAQVTVPPTARSVTPHWPGPGPVIVQPLTASVPARGRVGAAGRGLSDRGGRCVRVGDGVVVVGVGVAVGVGVSEGVGVSDGSSVSAGSADSGADVAGSGEPCASDRPPEEPGMMKNATDTIITTAAAAASAGQTARGTFLPAREARAGSRSSSTGQPQVSNGSARSAMSSRSAAREGSVAVAMTWPRRSVGIIATGITCRSRAADAVPSRRDAHTGQNSA